MKLILKILLLLIIFNSLIFSQNYEIKLDSANAYGWFGGDNRPGQQRNVAVAQSVTIEEPINLQSFAFYFTTPFDSAINKLFSGHEVSLKLQIRDSIGSILKTSEVVVADTFSSGWIKWEDLDFNIPDTGKYIFSSYLIGGYDSVQLMSSQACDLNEGYSRGERYAKYVVNDSDAAEWGDWSLSSWDANFWLSGNILLTNVQNENHIPNKFTLEQNYPNPFNPITKIKFTLTASPQPSLQRGEGNGVEAVSLKVYNILGVEVATLINEEMEAGLYEITFDASNQSSGVYYYQLKSRSYSQTKKMIFLK